MNVIYKKVTPLEIAAVGRLGYENWIETYKDIIPASKLAELSAEQRTEYYGRYLNRGDRGIIGAYNEENQLLAFSAYETDEEFNNCIYLASLQTAEAARGRGIGTALIKMTAEAGLGMGANRMRIGIFVGNDHAGNLYKKLGAKHLDYVIDEETFEGVPLEAERLMWTELCNFISQF